MERLEQIEQEIEVLRKKVQEMENNDPTSSWEEHCRYMDKEWSALAKLDREKRMIMPYELSELPDFGDVMPLESFIDCVKSGGFIDYDGHGYLSDGKRMSNMIVVPSKFEQGQTSIFDILVEHNEMTWGRIPEWATHVVWFNK